MDANINKVPPTAANDLEFPIEVSAASTENEARNIDPVTGEVGCHPVGSGVGAALGAAGVGAIAGAVGGPLGTVVGAIVGGVMGGMAGKSVAEFVNPSVELEYWRENYPTRPYYRPGTHFEHYRPAYQSGWEAYDGRGVAWEQLEPEVQKKWNDLSRWENEGGAPKMTWEEAKQAAQDAYERASKLNESTVKLNADRN
jgi:hypothetical protein